MATIRTQLDDIIAQLEREAKAILGTTDFIGQGGALVLRTPCEPGAAIPDDHHKHTCPKGCGTWEHHDMLPAVTTKGEFDEAHSCPKCGATQLLKAEVESLIGKTRFF